MDEETLQARADAAAAAAAADAAAQVLLRQEAAEKEAAAEKAARAAVKRAKKKKVSCHISQQKTFLFHGVSSLFVLMTTPSRGAEGFCHQTPKGSRHECCSMLAQLT